MIIQMLNRIFTVKSKVSYSSENRDGVTSSEVAVCQVRIVCLRHW